MSLKKNNIFSWVIILIPLLMGLQQVSDQIHQRKNRILTNATNHLEFEEVRWTSFGAKSLSFHQWLSLVDWQWIQFLQLPSHSAHSRFHFLDVISELDPGFIEAIVLGSSYLSVVDQNYLGAQKVLERSYEARYSRFFAKKEAWALPMMLGYVYLFDLMNMKKAKQVYQEAASEEGAPEYLRALASRFETLEGRIDLGFRVLGLLGLQVKTQPELKEKIEAKKNGLILLKFLNEVQKEYQKKSRISFERFLDLNPRFQNDPFGGKIKMNSQNQVVSTTPIEIPFHLGDRFD